MLPVFFFNDRHSLCICLKQSLMGGFLFLTDKLVNDTPKMTSSASQPDLLGGWDSWAAGKTASASTVANKSSYANTGELRNISIEFKLGFHVNVQDE